MSKLVVINIGEGNFEQGFPVTLQIAEESKLFYKDYQDRLPPAPKLPNFYRQWQQKYYGLEAVRRVIKPLPDQTYTKNFSIEDCEEAAEALEEEVKEWFEQRSLLNLRQQVLDEVGPNESARVIFQTQDELLRKLPWHLWDLFKHRRHAEFSISAKYAPPTPVLKNPVKILAILGGNEGIDTTKDEEILKSLPGAKVTVLKEPTREKLNDDLWDRPWDILFFAGHSSSDEGGKSGVIQLNDKDSLSLSKLKYALEKALENGLKLAIFNSCDGLGLANELAELKIPQVIVMREPVPDRVAQKFLRYFLEYFSTGEAFYIAVQKARKKLQGMEGEFPRASWLPVICQNPAENSPIWPRQFPIPIPPGILRWLLRNKKAVLAGGAIATAILVVAITQAKVKVSGVGSIPTKTSINQINSPGPDIADHISLGEKRLLKQNTNPDKDKGIQAFYNGQFDNAIKHFISSLRKNKNDPETLIYLNNAIAQQRAMTNTGKKLIIAASVPIGLDENVATETLRGVAQLQSELNCGLEEISLAIQDTQHELNCHKDGINGELLEVKIADDKDQPETAEQVAKAFANDSSVLGVIGHHSSASTLRAAEVYKESGLVAISSTSTSVSLSGFNFNKYFFRTVPSDEIAAKNLFDYMQERLGSSAKVAVAYHPNDPYSKSLKSEFQKLLPSQKFVAECDLSPGEFSASDCVNQAQQQQASVLLLAPVTKTDLDKALQVVNNNKGALKLLGGDAMYNRRTLQDSNEAAVKSELVIAVPWHNLDSEFAMKAQTFWGADINWRTATAYDAAQAIVGGLKQASCDQGEGASCRDRLKRELFRVSANGATGKVEFERSGDRKRSTDMGALVQVQPNPQPNPQPNSNSRYSFALLEQPQQ